MPTRYSSSWKPFGSATIAALPYLPCVPGRAIYGDAVPQDQRGAVDPGNFRNLLSVLTPAFGAIVLEMENFYGWSTDDVKQKQLADVLAQCGADAPGTEFGLYNLPCANIAQNVRNPHSSWFRDWAADCATLAMAPWNTMALVCPSLYAGNEKTPAPIDDDWIFGADYSLRFLRTLNPGRKVVPFVYPHQTAHMDWLEKNGWDCAVWES